MGRRKSNKGRRHAPRNSQNRPAQKQQQQPAQPIVPVDGGAQPPDNQTKTAGSDEPPDDQQPLKVFSRWRIAVGIIELFFAGAVAYFAWVQASLNKGQLAAMNDQNVIMENQIRQTDDTLKLMRAGQRPWLTVSAEPIDPLSELIDPDITLDEFHTWLGKWAIKAKNAGETPALNIRWAIDWHPAAINKQVYAFETAYWRQEMTRLAAQQWFDGIDETPTDITLAPGDPMVCRLLWRKRGSSIGYFPHTDPDERVRNFYQSRVTAAFIYDDIWGGEHTLFCCFRHNPDTGQLELDDCSIDYQFDKNAKHVPLNERPIGTTLATAKELLTPGSLSVREAFKRLGFSKEEPTQVPPPSEGEPE